MTTVPLELFITALVGVATTTGGIIYGLIARLYGMKVKAHIDVMANKLENNDKEHKDMDEFQKESSSDRAALHKELGAISGDVKAIGATITEMAKQLDVVYRKVLNGGIK